MSPMRSTAAASAPRCSGRSSSAAIPVRRGRCSQSSATAEDVAKIRTKLGLDRPLPVQFFTWVVQLAHGDLGNSIFSAHPVSELIGQRIEPTLTLTVMTLLISVLLAVPLGVVAAWRVG